MKLKNNKGVTLVALMITIIVMLIIASITVYTGSNLIKDSKVEDIKTNMLLVQATVKNYVEQAKFEGKNTIDGIKINEVTLTLSVETPTTYNGDTYYKITTNMKELNLGDLDSNNYLVAFDTKAVSVDVYYVPGITDSDGNTYHSLSEMETKEQNQ